jgi:hypothetical protein
MALARERALFDRDIESAVVAKTKRKKRKRENRKSV